MATNKPENLVFGSPEEGSTNFQGVQPAEASGSVPSKDKQGQPQKEPATEVNAAPAEIVASSKQEGPRIQPTASTLGNAHCPQFIEDEDDEQEEMMPSMTGATSSLAQDASVTMASIYSYKTQSSMQSTTSISAAQAAKQTRYTLISSFGVGLSTVAVVLLLLTSLNFSLNNMINGDKSKATSTSQLWFSIATVSKEVVSFWTSEFVGQSGTWFGRRQVMIGSMCVIFVVAALSLLAEFAEVPAVHVLAVALLGIAVPLDPTLMTYIADSSTADKFMRNTGTASIVLTLSLILGLVSNAVLSASIPLAYSGAGFAAVVGVLVLSTLPDSSPPQRQRTKELFRTKLAIFFGGPWFSLSTVLKQTTFTKLIVFAMGSGSGAVSAFLAFFVNYVLYEFGLDNLTINGILFVFFVGTVCMLALSMMGCVTPWPAMFQAGFFGVLAPAIMIISGESVVVFFLGMGLWLPCALATPAFTVVYMSQQPPSRRHELTGSMKLIRGMGSILGSISGGVWATIYFAMRDDGKDFPSPMWMVFILEIGLCVFILMAFFCFPGQDTRAYAKEVIQKKAEEKAKKAEAKALRTQEKADKEAA